MDNKLCQVNKGFVLVSLAGNRLAICAIGTGLAEETILTNQTPRVVIHSTNKDEYIVINVQVEFTWNVFPAMFFSLFEDGTVFAGDRYWDGIDGDAFQVLSFKR